MGVICFYLLLRQLEVPPRAALLGTAILGLNPLYLFLSYSFMTDVPFVALLLLASLLLVRGIQGHGEVWLWLGSIATALAYLTRQYGIIFAIAALASLWWSHRLSWRRAARIAAIPLVVFLAYSLWESTQPVRLELYLEAQMRAAVPTLSSQWFAGRTERLTWVFSATGLFLLPALRLPRRPLVALPAIIVMLFFQMSNLATYGTLFPENGSVIDHTGFGMFEYHKTPVLAEQVWTLAGIAGGVVFAFVLTDIGVQAWQWLRSRPWQHRSGSNLSLLIYTTGIAMAGGIFSLTPFIFDRYILSILPVLIIATLRRTQSSVLATNKERPAIFALRWTGMAALAILALLGLQDYKWHAEARWAAAESLLASGVPVRQIDAGFEWQGWNLYQEGARYIRQSGDYSHAAFPPAVLLDPVYLVSDTPVEGYTLISTHPYMSWLHVRNAPQVLVLKRASGQGNR